MKDGFQREIDYIRISLTDRCNLRCVYCMPGTGAAFLPEEEILTLDEILTVCRSLARMGIRKVKLTGGEPLLRKDVTELVLKLKRIPGIAHVSLTTNGVYLKQHIKALADSGIDGINISLDSTNEKRFEELTRTSCYHQVMEGIESVMPFSGIVLKLNCVLLKGSDARETAVNLAALAKDRSIHVRFIEIMPIGLGTDYQGCQEEEVKGFLEKEYGGMQRWSGNLGNGPCVYYTLPEFQGKIGFISAVSHGFCQSCNRIRLTCDGRLKGCLQFGALTDLKAILRSPSAASTLDQAIRQVIERKPEGHLFSGGIDINNQSEGWMENHVMHQIGG